jgi:2-oxo-4-hydroxy-4-carboxy-5-ureidoimidazoline decarboxylase
MNPSLLNDASASEAHAMLLRCCGSTRWAFAMSERRPFSDEAALFAAASETFASLTRSDWLEAFAAHPRIGDIDGLRAKYASTAAWSLGEQAGAASADEQTLHDLAAGNRDYEARFGHIFIVCATGRSAAEMLTLLRQRLPNDPDTELRIAAAEQTKITRLRLEKLLS